MISPKTVQQLGLPQPPAPTWSLGLGWARCLSCAEGRSENLMDPDRPEEPFEAPRADGPARPTGATKRWPPDIQLQTYAPSLDLRVYVCACAYRCYISIGMSNSVAAVSQASTQSHVLPPMSFLAALPPSVPCGASRGCTSLTSINTTV